MLKIFVSICICLFFPAVAQAQDPGSVIDTGTTAWMLTSTALVLLMVPGLAMFYGGLVRTKNVLGTMMHCFAAMALIDACVRLLPGVIGDEAGLEEESFEAGLLEYPHYTRPRLWEGHAVPDILLSGHHEQIAAWRQAERERVTRDRRPDLWRKNRQRGD